MCSFVNKLPELAKYISQITQNVNIFLILSKVTRGAVTCNHHGVASELVTTDQVASPGDTSQILHSPVFCDQTHRDDFIVSFHK